MTPQSSLLGGRADREGARFRLHIFWFGIQAQWLVVLVISAYALFARDLERSADFWWVLAIGGLVTAMVTILPWRRIVEQRWSMWVLYSWSVVDLVLITAAIHVTGGGQSPAFLIYGLTAVFFAAVFPLALQAIMLLLAFGLYVGMLSLNDFNLPSEILVMRFGFLAVITFFAGHLSRELDHQKDAHLAANAELARRADLLATVASAAREMTLLPPAEVLEVVADSVIALGFVAAGLGLFSEDRTTYTMAHSRGLPEEFVRAVHPLTQGVTGAVLATGQTVILEDYSHDERAVASLTGLGLGATISTPIFSDGEMVGVLTGVRPECGALSPHEIEVFELLASQAGRALESAHRFEIQRQTVSRLEELDQMKSDFLTTVSHELRTPLTAIYGTGRTLEERWGDVGDDLKRELIGRLNANTESLRRIIATLLDFSKIEAGKFEVKPEPVDLGALVHEVTDRLQGLFDNHPFTASVDEGMTVTADGVLVERVIENLLANAVQHTPLGTRVALAATREAGAIRVSVSDLGPGISARDLERLGERFFRGGDPNTRPSGGTGLGLAFVREVLSLHDTTLEIDSPAGGGATFSFLLLEV
ncbi:MAG: GAF domain-containing protein [Actinobacteria bacterium]|nr:GAF domain-containing protein [Actinomycetota bacterium]